MAPVPDPAGRQRVGRSEVLLPPRLRRPAAVVALLCAALLAVLGVRYAGGSRAAPVDEWVASVLVPFGRGPAVAAVTVPGDPPVAAALAAVVALAALVRRGWRPAAVVVVARAASGLVAAGLKHLVGRTIEGGLSLPSGHIAAVTSLAVTVALLVLTRRGRTPASRAVAAATALVVLAVAAVSCAVVATGGHYATDTLAGACTGAAVTLGTALVLEGGRSRSG